MWPQIKKQEPQRPTPGKRINIKPEVSLTSFNKAHPLNKLLLTRNKRKIKNHNMKKEEFLTTRIVHIDKSSNKKWLPFEKSHF